MVFRSSQLAEVEFLVSHSVYYNPHPAKVDRGELEYSDLSPLASMNDERSVHCELRGFESAARRGGERKKKKETSRRASLPLIAPWRCGYHRMTSAATSARAPPLLSSSLRPIEGGAGRL